MSGYIGILPVPQATETRNSFTATSSQTSFTTDGYTPNFVSVYLNGVLLSAADFTATNGTDVVLASGAAADDVVEVIAFSTFTVSAQTFTGDVTASGGTFLPTGDTSAGDAAAMGYAAADGLVLTGQGSTSDITLKNDADATVFTVPTGTDDILFPDNAKAMFGAGSDLQIYHDGSNSYIKENGSGALALQTNGTAIVLEQTDGENMILANINSDVKLYYDGSEKLATTSGGVEVTGAATVGGAAVKVAGKESIYVPAAAMYPSTTNPCSDLTQVETTALRPDLKVLDFAAAADDFAQFTIAFPKSWNEGTITFQPFWTVTGTNTGTVAWQLAAIAVSNDDSINTAFGTQVATTALAFSGTSNDLMVSAESGAVTIAGSPAANDMCFFQINRDTSADDQSGAARLVGIKLFFTTDAANDA
jgi:hypothetical protein